MRESGKNAKLFAGDDAYVSDVVDIKSDMDKIFDGVIALIQRAFGENIQVKRFRDTNDTVVVQGITGNLNSSQRNTISSNYSPYTSGVPNNGSPYSSQQFHHSPYTSGMPNNASPYASQQFNQSPYGTPKQPTVLSTPPQQIIPQQPQPIQTMAPSTPTQQQYMPVQQQPTQPEPQPVQQPVPEPTKLYNFGQDDNPNPDMPDLDNIDDIGSLIPQIRI